MSLIQWTEEHELFRKTVRQFVERELRPHAEEWEVSGTTPRKVWERCGELEFLGLTYPEAYGGLGADFNYTLIFAEELAQCGSPGVALGIIVQTDMATPALARHGNEYLKQTYLAPAIRGEQICAVAVSEPACGSDVAGLQTRAIKDGDEYVISGTKMFITNGGQADFVVLLARTSDDPGHKSFSLFVVPTNTPGFSRSRLLRKTCLMSSDTAELVLEQVRIPANHLIGKENYGFMYQMEQFQQERLVAVFQMVGSMKRAYELTKTYIQQRTVFGKRLSQMQVTRHKMAQMLSEIACIDGMAWLCAQQATRGEDYSKEVSMLKLLAAQTQQRVTEECVQLHGGYGLMVEYEVARYFRDAKLSSIGGGSNEVMKEIIAKMEGL